MSKGMPNSLYYKVLMTGNPEELSNNVLNEYYRVFAVVDDVCGEHNIITDAEVFINKRRVTSSWGDYEKYNGTNRIRIFPKGLYTWIGRKSEEEQINQMTCLLLHEIAHHLIDIDEKANGTDYKTHGREWQAVFIMILNRCGYDIEGRIKASGLNKVVRC